MLACAPDSCVHGRCVNGSCICDSGWSGNVDLLTQDLSPANGPVLKCTSHILTLKIMYGFAAGLSFFVIVFSFVGLIQQWGKYKSMLEDRQLQHWYQHTPLAFLLLCFTLGAPSVLLVAIIKLSSDHLNETVGVTHMASWSRILTIWLRSGIGYLNCHTAYALIQKRFSTGGEGRTYLLMRALNLVQMFAYATFAASGTSCLLVSSMTSPYSQRHVHERSFAAFFGQRTCAYIIMSGSSALLAWQARGYMDDIVETRRHSRSTPNLHRLAAEVADLQRTRKQVVANFISVAITTGLYGLINPLLLVVPNFRFYTSYVVATMDILYTLAAFPVIRSYTRLDCLFSRDQQPAPEVEEPPPVQVSPREAGVALESRASSPERAQQIGESQGTPWCTGSLRTSGAAGSAWSISLSVLEQNGHDDGAHPAAGGNNASSLTLQATMSQGEMRTEDAPAARPSSSLYSSAELTA
mmetsp:Transcript_25768/g.56484  ORF Transcript_25768/g.56484 Transcript_25768/m.56484 type:complete len:467 (+) Transcript_25768:95-1495(+)